MIVSLRKIKLTSCSFLVNEKGQRKASNVESERELKRRDVSQVKNGPPKTETDRATVKTPSMKTAQSIWPGPDKALTIKFCPRNVEQTSLSSVSVHNNCRILKSRAPVKDESDKSLFGDSVLDKFLITEASGGSR